MPSGIPKRLTDELTKLGYELESYRIDAPDPDFGTIPVLVGIEVKHRGRLLGVSEQKPRGWGGDDKWYTYPRRCPVGGTRGPLSAPFGKFNRQRDAIASLIRNNII